MFLIEEVSKGSFIFFLLSSEEVHWNSFPTAGFNCMDLRKLYNKSGKSVVYGHIKILLGFVLLCLLWLGNFIVKTFYGFIFSSLRGFSVVTLVAILVTGSPNLMN